jgi:hypothetical protein
MFLPVFNCGTGEPSFTRIDKLYLQLIEKVLVFRIFFSFILICPLSTLLVQLEERAISPAIPTFYTHNPLNLINFRIWFYKPVSLDLRQAACRVLPVK